MIALAPLPIPLPESQIVIRGKVDHMHVSRDRFTVQLMAHTTVAWEGTPEQLYMLARRPMESVFPDLTKGERAALLELMLEKSVEASKGARVQAEAAHVVRGIIDDVRFTQDESGKMITHFMRAGRDLLTLPFEEAQVLFDGKPFDSFAPDMKPKDRRRLARKMTARAEENRQAAALALEAAEMLPVFEAAAIPLQGDDAKLCKLQVQTHGDRWHFVVDGVLWRDTNEREARNIMLHLIEQAPQRYRAELAKQWKEGRDRVRAKKIGRECLKRADPEVLVEVRDALRTWSDGGFRLEKLANSGLHRLREAFRSTDGGVVLVATSAVTTAPLDMTDGDKSVPFVIEHDWAAAFRGAQDVDGGDIRLPYDWIAMELRISGRHVIALMSDAKLAPLVELASGRWVMPTGTYVRGDGWSWSCGQDNILKGSEAVLVRFKPLVDLICEQARALFIALDAEVATHEIVRAPEKLNRKRIAQGKLPMVDYHVVRVHRRTRAEPITGAHEKESRARMRLHFVRGHWRHYSDHRTWIKWYLRGDPDLGFIDKEYRL